MQAEKINDYLESTNVELANSVPVDLRVHTKIKRLMTKEGKIISVEDYISVGRSKHRVIGMASPESATFMGVIVENGMNKIKYIGPDKLKNV